MRTVKSLLMRYIELKTGYNDDGPAWIGYVMPSKSGRTLYFNDRALQSTAEYAGKDGCSNYFDIETGERFWVSGVKKNTTNRHRAARAKTPIQIDRRAVEEYCALTGQEHLNPNVFQIVDLEDRFPTERIRALENAKEEE